MFFCARLMLIIFLLQTNFWVWGSDDVVSLKNGTWFRLAFDKGGICKLDAAYLNSLGINWSIQNPDQLKVYGFKAGMLAQSNDVKPEKLVEIPVWKAISTSGKIQEGDFIMFYVQEPHPWIFDTLTSKYNHEYNLYSDSIYYFLNWSEDKSTRSITTIADIQNENTVFQNYYQRWQFHEKDLTNVLNSGREWFGESFANQSTHTIEFLSDHYKNDLPTEVTFSVMVQSKSAGISTFTFLHENTELGKLQSINSGECRFCFVGKMYSQSYVSENTSASALRYTIQYDRGVDANGNAFLNYISVLSRHSAVFDGTTFLMYNTEVRSLEYPGYSINFSNSFPKVWDITDPLNYTEQLYTANGNNITFGYSKNIGNKRFIVFDPNSSTLLKPNFTRQLPNQNVNAIANVDLIIVTHSSLRSEADRLANQRKKENIRTSVVTTEEIYNEFSGGKQDITAIRNFLKNVYQTNTGLKNVLLFGACSFDYKNRTISNSNLVPTYESRESLHDIFSYNSEDYFTFFASGTGNWFENDAGNHRMEIGIGRIPAATLTEAKHAVDKLFHYKSTKTLGKWRNRVLFTADNGDFNIHLRDADAVAAKIDSTLAKLNIQKVYISAFPLSSTPSGNRALIATNRMLDEIRKGVLLFNYSGHGGIEVLAQETLLDIPTIMAMNNLDKLPFFITATCDFGTYDNPRRFSGSKAIMLNPNGGGIGLITAVRPVFTNTNYALNLSFYNNLLTKNEAGQLNDLGTVFKNTKNGSISRSNRAFSLIGDPSMVLNFPKYTVNIDKLINGRTRQETDTIKALSIASITGFISRDDGQIDTSFNGFLEMELYDKKETYTTLEQEGTPSTTFEQRNNILYAGISRIRAGKYSVAFVVPKNINYSIGSGKFSAYAYDPNQLYDAAGENSTFKVGLSDLQAPLDDTPPEIELYINDSTFVNGQKISPNALLIAKLKDESGINISKASIGQDIRAVLNENAAEGWSLNEFYLSNVDDYTSGMVQYPLQNLPEGRHTLSLKAWDTYNNAADASVEFIVLSAGSFSIEKLWNAPNPVFKSTLIKAIHNRGGEELDVKVEIYNTMGAIVYMYEGKSNPSTATLDVEWNAISNDTHTMQPGMYVYRLTLKSLVDQKEATATQRLVLTH